MSTSANPNGSMSATTVPSSATHDTNPNTDSTLETTRPTSATSTAIGRIRAWWGNYVSWREDVRDDQISCICPISGPCRCEAGQVTVAGPS